MSTLRGSLKAVKYVGSQVYPPLQSAAEDFSAVLNQLKGDTEKEQELPEIGSDLAQWTSILTAYLSDDEVTSQKPELAEKILREQTDNLTKYQEVRGVERVIDNGRTMQKLRESCHQIETKFHQLQLGRFNADASLSTWKVVQEQLQITRLNELYPSHNARYNSIFSIKVERGACFQNTRATVLEEVRLWIHHASGAKVYWLNGMAGTGRTTIAYCVCDELELYGQLGANFFCSRAASDCQDAGRILPTIAYQLAGQFYPFRSTLCRILGQHPSISQCEPSVQFRYLIKDPLLEVGELLPNGIIVVIDALDECSDPNATQMILDLLFQDVAVLPIRFFLTSRPDHLISNSILSRGSRSRSVLHLHNVDEQVVKSDIETYLHVSLAQIPLTSDQIKRLADQSGVLFIYASTVARYILSGRAGANWSARLKAVLGGGGETDTRGSKKTQMIDRLYRTVLKGVLEDDQLEEDEVDLIKRMLWTVVSLKEPATKATLARLLQVDEMQLSAALDPLRSILNVLENTVVTLHTSFPEFMLSQERSGPSICCDRTVQNGYLVRWCFATMESQLRFNICELPTSFQPDNDVPDIQNRTREKVSPELSYSCRYWSKHLADLPGCNGLLSCVKKFLDTQLLFWMEVLNLSGKMLYGTEILNEAQVWLSRQDDPTISTTIGFMHDASQFVAAFAKYPVSDSTPHLYLSCLPLAPRGSKVSETYCARTHGLLQLGGSGITRWYDGVRAEVSSNDASIAPEYLPQADSTWQPGTDTLPELFDNRGPAGGGAVWDSWGTSEYDSKTKLCTPFPESSEYKGHATKISHVACSPDSTRIVSSSWDKTIWVWDARDGTPVVGPLNGHTDVVASVSFSPDGTRIVSGSWDMTIRVWDSSDGTSLAGPFEGHIGRVRSIAFSPDGARIISGSEDRAVRLWDSYNGTPLAGPFEGHTNAVTVVVYSPDGSCIVSGSLDATIRVWDASNGTLIVGPFNGHTEGVESVAFSPDGTHIVSGSSDRTVHVWDSHDGTQKVLVDPSKSHTDVVTSVAFSPDGSCIISGSQDRTIRVWRSDDGTLLGDPYSGHTAGVTSVTTAPNGKYIVSASDNDDDSIRVWDTAYIFGSLKPPISGLWDVDKDGWVRDSLQLPVLWVPEPLRDFIPLPPNILVIKNKSFKSRWDNPMLGNSWNRCYNHGDAAKSG